MARKNLRFVNGHRERICEIHKDWCKEKNMVRRGDNKEHWICRRCARSPEAELRAIMKERPELFKKKAWIPKADFYMLLHSYHAQKMSKKEIYARFDKLKTQLAVTRELERAKKFAAEQEKQSSFKEQFEKDIQGAQK